MTAPDPTAAGGAPADAVVATGATRRGMRDRVDGRRRSGPPRAVRPAKTRMRTDLALVLAVAGLVAGVATGAATSALAPTSSSSTPTAEADGTLGVSPAVDPRQRLVDRVSRTDERTLDAGAAATDPEPEAAVADAADVELTDVAATALPDGINEVDFAAGLLSLTVPDAASGTFDVVPGEITAPGSGQVVSVRIEVEHGLAIDGAKFADHVLATLNDSRSWGGDGSRTFSRTAGEAALTVTLASPTTVDRLCAPLDTGGLWSCGVQGKAVLNHLRWVTGSGVYGDNMTAYRQYLVNHEVGHVLGHRHGTCTSSTALAPVMVQQSGAPIACVPNEWPFP